MFGFGNHRDSWTRRLRGPFHAPVGGEEVKHVGSTRGDHQTGRWIRAPMDQGALGSEAPEVPAMVLGRMLFGAEPCLLSASGPKQLHAATMRKTEVGDA